MAELEKGDGLYCGVDVGAAATKLVLIDAVDAVVARVVRPSGVDYQQTAARCLEEARAEAGLARPIHRTVATGYGRRNVAFADDVATEIHCHATGCFHMLGGPTTLVDIGGQDNKVIRVDGDGRRIDFKMNRKCAAGTGSFLEEIALRLDLATSELEALAAAATDAARLSSFCTVFAKTEILAHLRAGVGVASIVRGAFVSVVTRVMEMAPLEGNVALTGGVVAHNPTVATLLEQKLGRPVKVPPHAQHAGALGAALLARQGATSKDGEDSDG